jgi:hypothetical protein
MWEPFLAGAKEPHPTVVNHFFVYVVNVFSKQNYHTLSSAAAMSSSRSSMTLRFFKTSLKRKALDSAR